MKVAIDLIYIEKGKDYNKAIDSNKAIFKIHCIETNKEKVTIITNKDNKVYFPPGSFLKGAIYPISIKKIVNKGGGDFIGYISSSAGLN